MKQIEEYVNKVYQHVKGNEKEIEDLKSEMKNHLLEAVHDLKLEGLSEQEAINIAIERFGKENELRSIISEMFQTQKSFGKRLLLTGLSIFLISIIIFGLTIHIGNKHESDQSIVAYKIGDIISNHDEISQLTKAEIEARVQKTKYITKLSAFNSNQATDSEPIYQYEREVGFPSNLFINSYSYGTDKSFVKLEVLDYRTFAIIVLFVGLTSFGVLFTIWAAIRIYHKRKSNVI
jgi:hypothetical protein